MLLTVSSALLGLAGVLYALAGLAMLLMGSAILGAMSQAGISAGMMGGFASAIGFVVLAVGAIFTYIALQLYNKVSWARLAASVLAVLSLLNFPLGTIAGLIILYALWADKETKAVFE
ncbi:hypothetical protein HY993_02345 [Candidatus Micrarchaeota archaeon]|nr:hypothetical protein [Candidatus Micrarchaeota archaeon]